ncbi:hypothetical protein ACFVVA_19485 [Kitasatospora sp. NPDC058048]|uniref:hypothetical protein n=1 Tax=Kitasatospora sp. NPDC058048 TaxID=3346313 RepID=UPI0036DC8CEF
MQFMELPWSEEVTVKVIVFLVTAVSEWLLQIVKGRFRGAAQLPPSEPSGTAVRRQRRSRRSSRRLGELKRAKARLDRAPKPRPPVSGRHGIERRRTRQRRRPGNRAS